MPRVSARTARDLHENYASIVEDAREHGPVIISNDGIDEVVLLSTDDYAKFMELLHENFIHQKLQDSVANAASPDAVFYDAEDVFAECDQILEAYGL